jgi:7,8-dihydro-6-hydroxymethylpterin-pyrophosphokinase
MYYLDQGWFLNCVAALETSLDPSSLLAALQSVETETGRAPSVRYGPRAVDLDVLFYGSEVVSLPGLVIPHPRIAERRFVLVPLVEMRPGLVHPLLGRTARELLDELGAGGPVVRMVGRLDPSRTGPPRPP